MNTNTKLSYDAVCTHCGAELEIDAAEQQAGRFTCPQCQNLNTEIRMAETDSDVANPLKGVAGWLKFFVVVRIYIDPVVSSILLLLAFIGIGELADVYPNATIVVLIEIGVGIYLIVFGIQTGIALRDIAPGAVQKAKKFLLLVLGWAAVAPFLEALFGLSDEAFVAEGFKNFLRAGVSFAIWYTYFSVSKRVKATYADA